jgi:hypothetical protein
MGSAYGSRCLYEVVGHRGPPPKPKKKDRRAVITVHTLGALIMSWRYGIDWVVVGVITLGDDCSGTATGRHSLLAHTGTDLTYLGCRHQPPCHRVRVGACRRTGIGVVKKEELDCRRGESFRIVDVLMECGPWYGLRSLSVETSNARPPYFEAFVSMDLPHLFPPPFLASGILVRCRYR